MTVFVKVSVNNFRKVMRNQRDLREQLADVQHEIWAHWMRFQFACCIENEDGSLTIPADKVARWRRQIETPYCQLSEPERKSDRQQANKVLQILHP